MPFGHQPIQVGSPFNANAEAFPNFTKAPVPDQLSIPACLPANQPVGQTEASQTEAVGHHATLQAGDLVYLPPPPAFIQLARLSAGRARRKRSSIAAGRAASYGGGQ